MFACLIEFSGRREGCEADYEAKGCLVAFRPERNPFAGYHYSGTVQRKHMFLVVFYLVDNTLESPARLRSELKQDRHLCRMEEKQNLPRSTRDVLIRYSFVSAVMTLA